MSERLHFRMFGTFEAEVIGDRGRPTPLDSSAFRPLVRLLAGLIVEDGGDNLGIDASRVVRVLWDETVNGPAAPHRRLAKGGKGSATQEYVESIRTGDEIARTRLNRTLNELRAAVGDQASEPRFVQREGDMLRLVNTTADVNEFHELWGKERFEEALGLIERGVFLSGTRLQQRNESAQHWLEMARVAWSNRIDSCLTSRERACSKQNDREGVLKWARARKRLADAYGYRELIERASYDIHDLERDRQAPSLDGPKEMHEERDGFRAEVAARLDAWGVRCAEDGTVMVALGHASARERLSEVTGFLSARGVAAQINSGGFGRFGHASATWAALAEATHCIYLLADEEQPTVGWPAFAGAAASKAEIPFQTVRVTTRDDPAR